MGNYVWKVNNEDKYFKSLGGGSWGEFANGRQVFSFSEVSRNGDQLVLRKTDGSLLRFDSSKVTIQYG